MWLIKKMINSTSAAHMHIDFFISPLVTMENVNSHKFYKIFVKLLSIWVDFWFFLVIIMESKNIDFSNGSVHLSCNKPVFKCHKDVNKKT